MRERGSDTQQWDPGWKLNPGPLLRGQSLCTWDAHSTNQAKHCPSNRVYFNQTQNVLVNITKYLCCLIIMELPQFSELIRKSLYVLNGYNIECHERKTCTEAILTEH